MVEKESYRSTKTGGNLFIKKGLSEICLKKGMNLQKGMHTIIIPGNYSGMELAPLIVQ